MMTLLSIFHWTSQKEFLQPFVENETKLQQARLFWKSLEETDLYVGGILVFITAFCCISYYTWFNNISKPFGYHYRRRYWAGAWAVCGLLLIGCLLGIDQSVKFTGLVGADGILTQRWICVGICYSLLYLILSCFWCLWFPTNAYRLFKF